MLHTLWRFVNAACAALTILIVFALWGVIASLASNHWAPLAAVVVVAGLFFAPAAYLNAWHDFGD